MRFYSILTSLLFIIPSAALSQECDIWSPPGTCLPVAGAPPQVIVTVVHFNPVMQPRNIVDGIQECRRNTVCNSALNAALASLGVPPEILAATRFIPTSGSRRGEESTYTVNAGANTTICQVDIATTSVVPLRGNRASFFSASASGNQVSLYAWTPSQGLGKGRSWWDGTVTITAVRTSDLGRVAACGLQAHTINYACRGDGNNTHGEQACGSARLGVYRAR